MGGPVPINVMISAGKKTPAPPRGGSRLEKHHRHRRRRPGGQASAVAAAHLRPKARDHVTITLIERLRDGGATLTRARGPRATESAWRPMNEASCPGAVRAPRCGGWNIIAQTPRQDGEPTACVEIIDESTRIPHVVVGDREGNVRTGATTGWRSEGMNGIHAAMARG